MARVTWPVLDTWVSERYGATNHAHGTGGDATWVSTGHWPGSRHGGMYADPDGANHYTQGLFKPDPSRMSWNDIPEGVTITSAKLELSVWRSHNNRSSKVRVLRNPGGWTDTLVTWNTKPGNGAVEDSGKTVSPGNRYEFDITDWARDARFGNTNLRSYGVKTIHYNTVDFGMDIPVEGVDFYATHGDHSSSLHPKIVITYELDNPTISNAAPNANQSRFSLSGTGSNGNMTVEVAESASGPWGFAFNENQVGSWSELFNVTAPKPGTPSITLTPSGTSIVVSWPGVSRTGVTRYFRAYNTLAGGGKSPYSNTRNSTLTPEIQKYEIYRYDNINPTPVLIGTVTGTTTSFTDTAPPAGRQLTYVVYATNYQDVKSDGGFNSSSVTVSKPPTPTFTNLTIVNGDTFRLNGGSFPLGSASNTLKVYLSTSVSGSYSHWATVVRDSPGVNQTTGAWQYDTSASASNPNPAVVNTASNLERTIRITWDTPSTPGVTRYFKVSAVVNGVESDLSSARSATISPTITRFILQRKLEGQSDFYFADIYDSSIHGGLKNTHDDTQIESGKSYVYRVISYNSQGKTSTSTPKTATPPLVGAPTIFDFLAESMTGIPKSRIITLPNGSQYTRITGAARNEATAVELERSLDGAVWLSLGNTTLGAPEGGTGSEEWWKNDEFLPVQAPRVPSWDLIEQPVDTDGIKLNWTRPTNVSSNFNYRAIRKFGDVRGIPSRVITANIQPFVTSYAIQRRLNPLSGEDFTAENDWTLIKTLTPSQGNVLPPTSFIDRPTGVIDPDTEEEVVNGILFDRTYDYRIVAINNFGVSSEVSVTKTFNTFSPPPPPPPPPDPIKPEVGNGRPRGTVDIAGTNLIRLVWDYEHENDEPQKAYSLSITYDTGTPTTKFWNGASWVNTPGTFVQSSNHYADVDFTTLPDDEDFNLTLIVEALGGGLSDPYSDWPLTGAVTDTVFFPTRRIVTRTYTEKFPIYRRITTRSALDLSLPSLGLAWAVEPQLPLVVDDLDWEGGGNTWSWVVFDNEGRPEAYAELDFEKPGYERHFTCDSRGRINITIPDQLEPGIYTFRERGPSMAPRTIENFVVVDPWMIMSHGHRHSSEGPDPVYGITKEQISDTANIHPSQVEGAESLGDLVDAYGSNIQEGLERHLSAGHGFYVSEGLDAQAYTPGSITIEEGVAWENERLRDLTQTTLTVSTDGTYKIFVADSLIQIEKRNDFPPSSTPLYTLVVSGTLATGVVTDNRLRHPDTVTSGIATPVRWGAEKTNDIIHNDADLATTLSLRLNQIRDRFLTEETLHEEFRDEIERIQRVIDEYEADKRKAREAMLGLGYATYMKQLYNLFDKRAAQGLLLDHNIELLRGQFDDVVDYLNNISNSGVKSRISNLSAFQVGDELSSLTTLLIRNGVATLPNNWTKGTQYTFRTLRIGGAPAKYLDFHVVYEYVTGQNFRVFGSQSSDGKYIPQSMNRIKTVKDNNLKSTFETTRDCFIDTYRTYFDKEGDESTIEMLVTGGDSLDGVRIRGFAIVTA
jgi:hypothetical protein